MFQLRSLALEPGEAGRAYDPVWTISSGLTGGDAVAPVKAMVSARMGGE